jgi:hypothetical protein
MLPCARHYPISISPSFKKVDSVPTCGWASSAARQPASRSPQGEKLVGLSRFELLTPRLSSVCSNQLSYRPEPFQRTVAGSLKTGQCVRSHENPRARSISE